jgi:phosphoribosylanthranilate isomerase
MSVRVKICGVRTAREARWACAAGADAVGLNFVPGSPRFLNSWDEAQAITREAHALRLLTVGLFVNPSLSEVVEAAEQLGLGAVQLHGEEPPELGSEIRLRLRLPVWKAQRVSSADELRRIEDQAWPCDVLLLDAHVPGGPRGGTGRSFDWAILAGFARRCPLALAGGLTPANVREAVRLARPDWVDTASGVESAPGVKDEAKVRQFVKAAKQESESPV